MPASNESLSTGVFAFYTFSPIYSAIWLKLLCRFFYINSMHTNSVQFYMYMMITLFPSSLVFLLPFYTHFSHVCYYSIFHHAAPGTACIRHTFLISHYNRLNKQRNVCLIEKMYSVYLKLMCLTLIRGKKRELLSIKKYLMGENL